MRLIDADALKERLKEYCIDGDEQVKQWYDIMGIDETIDNAQTIDAVPLEQFQSMEATCVKLQKAIADTPQVVRCKDCRHWSEMQNSAGACLRHSVIDGSWWTGTDSTDYCSFAERKDND